MSVITSGGVTSTGDIVVNDSTNDVLDINQNGQISQIERTVTAGSWNLTTGNNWTCGNINIPSPINGVAGQTGVLRLTAAPASWPSPGGTLKYPKGEVPDISLYPVIIPFYVQNATNVLLGTPVEGIS